MKTKIAVIRAVSSTIAQRALRLASILAIAILIAIFLTIWALAYFVSSWWWLLLVVYIPLVVITLSVYAAAKLLIRKLYGVHLNPNQRELVTRFTDKVQRLLETRGMGWWFFAALCMRDLLFYRELRTLKSLLDDTKSLRKDFETLERTLSVSTEN